MEHRLKNRIRVAYPAQLICRGPVVIEGLITDVSPDGAFLATVDSRRPRVNGLALLEFSISPRAKRPTIERHAIVVHIQHGKGIGLMFLDGVPKRASGERLSRLNPHTDPGGDQDSPPSPADAPIPSS